MIIWVDNHSSLQLSEIREVIRAINTQISRDFDPIFGRMAELRLKTKKGPLPVPKARNVGHIHLTDNGAAPGFHRDEADGIPAGFVITNIPEMIQSNNPWLKWTVCFSHEVLELIADPHLNTFVRGPHPKIKGRQVFHYREVCDPVQSVTYHIGGVEVSNFVTPHYYNAIGAIDGRNDFCKAGVKAFRWIEDGEIGFLDPHIKAANKYQVFPVGDKKSAAAKVRQMKGEFSRLHRYGHPHTDGSR
jgi:hypothetical protein